MNISMIAAIGKNNELGKKNGLLWHLPGDLKFFKSITKGKTIIMGRKTFESLPGILPNRRNIVLMMKDESPIDGVIICYSIEEVLNKIKDSDEEVFIIGGGSVYKSFLPYANKLYLTEVDASDNEAEVYFPKFDKDNYIKKVIGENMDNGIKYHHILYVRR